MARLWIERFLRVIAWLAIVAFGAAIMPQKWIVEIAEELSFEPFPHSPLTFYLARNLSLMYGFVGCLLLIVLADLDRYRPLIRWIAIGTIAFGVLQTIVDLQSSMPWWWTLFESSTTIIGGILIAILNHLWHTQDPMAMALKRQA